jgi:kynurenine formamidase
VYTAAHVFSLEIVAKGGIVDRGVLIDYASWASLNSIPIHVFTSTPIPFAHIKQIIRKQDITFRQGDILFIRAGYSAAYDTLSEAEQNAIASRPSPNFIGLEASREVVEWCWANKFAAVASDTPSFERAPVMGAHHDPEYVLHEWLLAGWGMLIGELFNLEKLAEKCKEVGRWSFFLSSVPLNVPGGVASPLNAVAIF